MRATQFGTHAQEKQLSDISGSEPTVDTPAGEPVESGEQTVTEPSVFADFDTYADHVVPITVEGEEVQVPLRELQQGYQRQADYTRKTQELAEQRKALSQAEAIVNALRQDPERTLEVLRERGFIESPQGLEEPEYLSDEERDLAEIKAYIAEQQNAATHQALEAELNGLVERYGVDRDELVDFAVSNDIRNLTQAYAVMDLTKRDAERMLADREAQATAAREQAKRDAAVVSGGEGRNPAAAKPPSTGHGTLESAFAAAKQAHGR